MSYVLVVGGAVFSFFNYCSAEDWTQVPVRARHQLGLCNLNLQLSPSLFFFFFFPMFQFPKRPVNCRLQNGDWKSSRLEAWLRGEHSPSMCQTRAFSPSVRYQKAF